MHICVNLSKALATRTSNDLDTGLRPHQGHIKFDSKEGDTVLAVAASNSCHHNFQFRSVLLFGRYFYTSMLVPQFSEFFSVRATVPKKMLKCSIGLARTFIPNDWRLQHISYRAETAISVQYSVFSRNQTRSLIMEVYFKSAPKIISFETQLFLVPLQIRLFRFRSQCAA